MHEFLVASILSALATGLGALPVLFFQKATHRWRDILLAFTAGIMVAAATFELIPEAIEMSNILVMAIGVLMGVFLLTLLERTIPHIDLGHNKQRINYDQKSMLIVAAIALHNLPEGLAVGVSYGSGIEGLGPVIAIAIGLQNAPEGFLVALFLVHQQVSKWKAVIIATLTGAVEIVTAIIGFYLTAYVANLVPIGLAFAAGSMLYIVYKEIIPESHGDGHALSATYAFVFGLLAMNFLTSIF